MRISRNYKAQHWKALTFASEADWQTAVTIFIDRLETRYLMHIRELLRHRTTGFAVLTLDCAIVETLEQFRRESKETPRGQGKQYFTSFLTETSFSKYVTEKQAGLFYKTIRCGLLHQAEAKSSLVKRSSTLPLIAFTQDKKGLIVNAKAFHKQLEETIHEYTDKLLKPESASAREAFRNKMNSICQV
jgi:hypothetical protein